VRVVPVKRIVSNIATTSLEGAEAFYGGILGMAVVMDHGWIKTFGAPGTAMPQISIATEGGSGTVVPDVSIEVDDLDYVYDKAVKAGIAIEYGPVAEPWGVRRFFARDPFGRLLNILSHDR
jgi:catechol 2,3-dioxygenase-like lactoylglutathione lyase family enzyme